MTPHVILTGNPADGFAVIGPFGAIDDAVQYLNVNLEDEDAWIVELYSPKDYSK